MRRTHRNEFLAGAHHGSPLVLEHYIRLSRNYWQSLLEQLYCWMLASSAVLGPAASSTSPLLSRRP